MKTLLKFIGIIILLVIVYAVIAMLAFSKDYHYEKSIVINASKEKVWQYIGSNKGINAWNPFAKGDPNIQITYSGTSGQVGDTYKWKGNEKVGEGEQTVTDIIPNEKLGAKLHFIKPFEGDAKIAFVLTPNGNGTKVTWIFDNEMNTMMKPMKPMMDMNMNKMFNQGLEDLKKLSEK
ncbi:Carbon monoxide dehydrogenase subunit G [Chryseobacterium ureilyticum]|uniref:Carbon monoxide dehydrogenase subunit G n=1 Tax=Chryseobacterium ureilyticum TaxID=373668 RepID=A0A1N7LZ29_9FLAO|nr:SRPBCC family protein [Chryseobacterium ureilyticum]SIS79105.1 Carbon monoxide dehydrogenase subunit G [Chryseobacterium ureilyticum]